MHLSESERACCHGTGLLTDGVTPCSCRPTYGLWVCDQCGHWHGASYNTWPDDQPPRCKIRGYGRDGKGSCGAVMRRVYVAEIDASL